MITKDGYRPLYNRDTHKCFGCSPVNTVGLQMKFMTDGESVISCLKVPDHLCGWNNLIHGGVIATILDEIMSWAAIYQLKQIILTKSMAVDFIKPVFIGKMLTAKGRVIEVKSKRDVLMEGFIYNDEKELCAKSHGTFALFTPDVARRLNIMDLEALRNFEDIIAGTLYID